MNKNRFRKVFNQRLGALVAVGEDVNGQSKAQGEGIGGGSALGANVVSGIKGVVLAIVLALAETTAFAQSLPTSGQYTAGSGSISINGNTLTVDQNTQRGVINWNTFNVGAGNTVQFNQPNAQSKTLNIVSGGLPSNIQGSLLANGQIFIQNSSGIFFGKGAVVNVGSLLATTKAIDPNAFMNGDVLTLSSTGKSGVVQNDGNIQASGFVTLVGDQVRNTGSITVPGGQVVLAAGDSATVALANGQGLSLTLTNATASALVENSGQIVADNGSVLLTARGSDTLLKTVVNMSGVVQAGSGAIVADAGSTGDVIVTGKLDASNLSAGGVGGDVVLSGNRIGLSDTARIDVSGDGDAGYVVIGGDTLHKVPGTKAAALIDSVTFADTVQIDPGAQIMARSVHGNGGFLETSGRYLNMQGQVDASAPNGKNGSWLIDPTDVTISADHDVNYTGGLGNGTFYGSGETAIVNNASIETALSHGTDVAITTAGAGTTAKGNISVEADIISNGNQGSNLTLLADNNLYIGDQANVRIGADGGGALNANMVANGTAYVGGAGHKLTFDTHGDVNITGGSAISGEAGLQLAGNVHVVSGNVALTGSSDAKEGVNALANSTLSVAGGHLDVCGSSNATPNSGDSDHSAGVHLANLTVTSNGSANVAGVGVSGVYVDGDLTVSDHGSIDLNGKGSWWGVQVAGDVGVSDGSLRINGAAGSTGIGAEFYTESVSVSRDGELTIAGSGEAAGVIVIARRIDVADDAHLAIYGSSMTSGELGVGIVTANEDGFRVSGNGAVSIAGDSIDGMGVYALQKIIVSEHGSVTISGDSTNGTGVRFEPSLILSGNGSIDVSGNSTNGTGVQLDQLTTIDVSDHGSLGISGRSTNGIGTNVTGWVNISGHGLANVSGHSTNGSGVLVDQSGSVDISGCGAVVISGSSVDGNGLVVDGALSVAESGAASMSGDSENGVGTLIDLNGGIRTSDAGSSNITGNSSNGAGVYVNGTVDVSGEGATNIRGKSTYGASVIQAGNGAISARDDSSLNVSAPGTSKDDFAVNISGNAKVNVDTSIPANTTPTDPTAPADPADPTPTEPINTTPGGGVINPASGGDSGGGGSAGAVVGGVLGAVGVGALVMNIHGVVYLEQPVALVLDAGDVSYWGRVLLEHLQIDMKSRQAEIALQSPDGPLKRQLKLTDGGDGVQHYALTDEPAGMRADLTFNPKTSEYFYTESGVKMGRAYKVSAHGWLKERASLGAPIALAEANAIVQAAQASPVAK